MAHDYLSTNQRIRDADAANWVATGERLWNLQTPEWGNWGNSDESLSLLPTDIRELSEVRPV